MWEYTLPPTLYWKLPLWWLPFSGRAAEVPFSTQGTQPRRAPISFDLAFTMLDPGTILSLVQCVGSAAKMACDTIDDARGLDQEVKYALQDLRQRIQSLKSDTMMYRVLITAMQNDISPYGPSTFAIFIVKYVWSARASHYTHNTRFATHRQGGQEAMQSFKAALEVAQLMLEENLTGNSHEVTKDPSGSNKPEKALNFVLTVLKAKANLRPGFIGNLKNATMEIYGCQQDTERAFKLVWNLYAITQQYIGRRSSAYPVYNNVAYIQGNLSEALNSVLHAFHLRPFAFSQEGDRRFNLLTFNHNDQTATRYEELARRIGKAWVDDRIQMCNAPLRDLSAFQTSLFELLWSGTIEQLKKCDVNYGDDPERPVFEKALLELEVALREVIVRSKKRRFAIAFCGMVKAGKSLFLNALMGRAILPSDGEFNDPHTTGYYSEYHSRAPFYGLAVPTSSC